MWDEFIFELFILLLFLCVHDILRTRIKNNIPSYMANLKLRAAIIQTVNQQLNKNNPPEVRIALGRMMDNDPDCDYDEAFRRIAVVLVEEMFDMLKNKKTFNTKIYAEKLRNLK